MGWSSGAVIFSDIIDSLKDSNIDEEIRKTIYQDLINIFEQYDCDNLDDCLDKDDIFDEVWYDIHPQDKEVDIDEYDD